MALPSPGFYTTTGGEITTKDFGSVEAGAYKPGSTGWKFRLYNSYGSTESGIDDMTSVKMSIRGTTGGIDQIWVQQHWVQIKSSSGSTGVVDDAQTVFTAVGKNKELSLGDIPSGEYRTLYARCYPPTDAAEQGVAFQLRATYQQPATSICSWITGLRGNGVVASTGDPFAMSTGGSTGTIPYEAGYALIYNNEIYYGSSGSYDITTTGSGTYKIYLNESGAFGETTGSVAANQLELYEATISSGDCTALDDKRVYLAGLQSGTTGAMPTTPDLGDMYLDIINKGVYIARTAGNWTLAVPQNIEQTLEARPTHLEDQLFFGELVGDATNQNTTGIGVLYQKLGAEIQLKGIHSTGNITVTDSTGTITINLDVNSTGIKLDDLGTPDDNTDLDASTGAHGLLLKRTGSTSTYLRADGTWATPPGATGGEANTASNVNTTGVGVYEGKVGVDLQFKGIRAGSSKATVTDTTGTHTISVDINSTGILLDSLGTPSTGTSLDATTGVHGLLPVGDADTTHYLAGDISWVSTTGIVLDSLTTPSTGTALNSSTGRHGLLMRLDGNTSNYLRGDGAWQPPPGATGGEANTASNAGTTGIGIYYQKTGIDLEFKGIHSTGNISVTDSTGTITVNLDVISTGIKLDDLGTPDDNTDLNATTGHHGLLLKLTGSTSTYLNADGAWATPPGATGGATNFLQLTDTPANYTGDASKILTVTTGEDAVEFIPSTGILLDNLGTPEDNTDLNATTGLHGLLPKGDADTTHYLAGDISWVSTTGIVLDSLATPTTGTALNATTGLHGLLPKRDGNAAHWLDGAGLWTAPTASEVGALGSSGAFTVNAIPQITSTGGVLKASVFAVTTGDVFNFGAHSAGFTEQAIAISTGATAIDWNNGLKALYTRSTGSAGAATFTFTAPVKSANLMLTIRGSTVGSTGTVTWPAVKWDGGSVPSLGSGASDINVVSFYYSTGLTSYLGQCSTGTFSS